MLIFIAKRFLSLIFSLFIVTIIVFTIMHNIPGGPFDEDNMPLSKVTKEKIMKMYGLDQPLHIQYFKFIRNALQLKFGTSYQYPGEDIIDIIKKAGKVSAFLCGMSLLWAVPLGILMGIISAIKANRWIDYLFTAFSSYHISIPVYVNSIIMIYIFSLGLKWLPTGGFDGPKTWIMPVIAYGFYPVGVIIRYTRSSMIEVLNEPYILTAKSKGLHLNRIIVHHAFRNALLPILTIVFPMLTGILTGSVFVEKMFRIPGLGGYLISSVYQRDYPMVMTLILLITLLMGITYFIIDILYTIIDPRIRFWGTAR